VPQSRGLDDRTLRMIADKGGAIGVHFAEPFLNTEVWRHKHTQHGLPPDAETPRVPMTHVSDLANVIDYLIKVAGQDHVGLGGGVNGIDADQWPPDMRNVGELPHLTAELLRRGYSRETLHKLYYENWWRVYAETLPQAPVADAHGHRTRWASAVLPLGTQATRPGGHAILAHG